ncbi:MAG: hypothetical protein FJ087_10475 [Deltaproteobacteria bacterium]|nr:hypothetical protein [Deltaproteobacteria bacterium]
MLLANGSHVLGSPKCSIASSIHRHCSVDSCLKLSGSYPIGTTWHQWLAAGTISTSCSAPTVFHHVAISAIFVLANETSAADQS